MKDHISALLKLSNEEQESGLKSLFDQILGDLDWINEDYYCKSIKQLFLGVELDNLFYREESEYEAYEKDYGYYKQKCKKIPVYSFRYLSAFNKFFENKFEKAITTDSVKAQMISQIFA